MSRLFKSIAREFAADAGAEICRGYMIERLRNVTATDLHKAIKDGLHTLTVSEDKDRNFGRKWSRVIERFSFQGKRLQRDLMTPENVLEWLKADRPDLASLIINMGPDGMNWLREDVKQIYAFLFPSGQKPALTFRKREQPIPSSTPEKIAETPKEVQTEPSEPTVTQQETSEIAEKA